MLTEMEEKTEEESSNGIRNSLGIYAFTSFVVFLFYTFFVSLGVFMLFAVFQLGFFESNYEFLE